MTIRTAAMAMAFTFFLTLPVTASPPVPPPVETSSIHTVTDIECTGTVRESAYYTRQWIGATDGDPGAQNVGAATVPFDDGSVSGPGNPTDPNVSANIPDASIALQAPGSHVGTPGREPALGAGDTAGEIRYELEFNAVGGQTAYHKVFDSHSGGTPEDLDVDLTFAFAATQPNGNLSFNESVGLTVVSNGFDVGGSGSSVTDSISGLCPWVQDPGGNIDAIPATNELVAMGSEILNSSAVTANTATHVGASVEVPNVSYAIFAQGQGFIEASMAAQIQEGFGKVGWAPAGDPVFTLDTAGMTQQAIDEAKLDAANYRVPAGVVAPGMASFEQYEETSSASGQWTFSKSMAYESQVPVLQIPTPF